MGRPIRPDLNTVQRDLAQVASVSGSQGQDMEVRDFRPQGDNRRQGRGDVQARLPMGGPVRGALFAGTSGGTGQSSSKRPEPNIGTPHWVEGQHVPREAKQTSICGL